MKLSFFNKAHFSEVLLLRQWVSLSGKNYYVLLLVLLVFNKFIEINTLIKRNVNFKCEVKSHKVLLPVYCNNKILSILFENKVLTNWHTSGEKIITRYFKKLNNLIFIYNWKNRYWIRYLFRYLIQNNHNTGPNILLLYNVLV